MRSPRLALYHRFGFLSDPSIRADTDSEKNLQFSRVNVGGRRFARTRVLSFDRKSRSCYLAFGRNGEKRWKFSNARFNSKHIQKINKTISVRLRLQSYCVRLYTTTQVAFHIYTSATCLNDHRELKPFPSITGEHCRRAGWNFTVQMKISEHAESRSRLWRHMKSIEKLIPTVNP